MFWTIIKDKPMKTQQLKITILDASSRNLKVYILTLDVL
jgi:hypothetical protein